MFGNSPITFRYGDFNQDSFPDMLISLQPLTQSGTISSSSIRLLENIECTEKTCTEDQRTFQRRTFAAVDASFISGITGLSNPLEATFIDISGDGKPDIIVNGWNPSDSKPVLSALANMFFQDAFVLTALSNFLI